MAPVATRLTDRWASVASRYATLVIDPVELLRSLHGHFGVLAAAALLHPVVFLKQGRPLSRGQRWSVSAAAALYAGTMAGGLALYPHFRTTERPAIMQQDFALQMWFERKEHLVYVGACLVLSAFVMVTVSRDGRHHGRARWMFALAAAVTVFAAIVGTTVGSWRTAG